MDRLAIGTRVELHPSHDLWMMGARYGIIVGFGGRPWRGETITYRIKLDKYAPVVRVALDGVEAI